ncbi:Protein split ends [Amphibalanus amphitrite]|uniref:Protein split ends n=1 Tax=Amphibalanus amphitrite TaxID=1232801 RepID=A0A6A4WL86_AMPAM|nr:Protein split ends [Amphibalanus amphitrite]
MVRAQGSRYRGPAGWYGGELARFGGDLYAAERSPGVGKALARRGSPAALQHARVINNIAKPAQSKRCAHTPVGQRLRLRVALSLALVESLPVVAIDAQLVEHQPVDAVSVGVSLQVALPKHEMAFLRSVEPATAAAAAAARLCRAGGRHVPARPGAECQQPPMGPAAAAPKGAGGLPRWKRWRRRRNKRGGLSSAVAAVAASNNQSGSVSSGIGSSSPQPNGTEDRKPIAIYVKNLPARSSDTSLKDGLFHEYKKHGKVTTVKIIGQGAERYAIVCFKKPEDAEKALNVSHDKSFFGSKIEVALYDGFEVDDSDHRLFSRQCETKLDEYHPKATRTLFIGNLDKDVKQTELRKAFEKFGEIIGLVWAEQTRKGHQTDSGKEVDIKKQQSAAPFAFLQFTDIESVVKAMRAMDGAELGGCVVRTGLGQAKLGFGRSMPTNCVWIDGVADAITDKYLARQFSKFGSVVACDINRARGHALVTFESASPAQVAVIEMRGRALGGKKLQIDFASRECQDAFFEHLSKQPLRCERDPGGYRFVSRYDRGRSYRGGRYVRRGGRFDYDEFARDPAAGYDDSYAQELREYYSQRHGDPEYRRVQLESGPPYSPARRRSADRSPSASRSERRAQLQSVVTVGRPARTEDSLPPGSGDETGERPAKRARTSEPREPTDPRPAAGGKRAADSDGGKPIEVHVTARRGSDARRSDSRRVSVDSVKADEPA